MSNIVNFRPLAELEAEQNLKEFIRLCKEELTVFGEDLDWEDYHWPTAGVSFGNLDKKTRILQPENKLQQPFAEFAKAYFRYQQGHNPTKLKSEKTALKCVERALLNIELKADILLVNTAVLDEAAHIAREYYSKGVAYQVGCQVKRLADFLNQKQLTTTILSWKNPIKKAEEHLIRTGKKAKELREKALPNDDALDALAEIFASNPTDGQDILTTSVAAILMCVPARISEVIGLTVDCEVFDKKRDGTDAYGLGFIPSKGGAPQVKWVPDSMVSIAQEAIRRLKAMTQETRDLARWLEKHPDKFYRHLDCPDVAEDQPLSMKQVCQALGFRSKTGRGPKSAFDYNKITMEDGVYSLARLNDWVQEKKIKGFPWFDEKRKVRFSNALIPLRKYQLEKNRTTSPIRLAKPTSNTFNVDLCSSARGGKVILAGLFERHGYNKGREEELKITTHQFRHLLNTIAQRGGLSQAQIAKWSGRADGKQNRHYDHMDEFELVGMLRSIDNSLNMEVSFATLQEQISSKLPMERQEFNALIIPTAHITEYGFCTHDYTMSPCQKFRDCLNCTEQVCIKGDRRLTELRELRDKQKELLVKAEQEIAEGTMGADRWYEHHKLTFQRIENLLKILENSDIDNGAVIRLANPNEFSPLRRAVERKVDNSKLEKDNDAETILRNLLGDE